MPVFLYLVWLQQGPCNRGASEQMTQGKKKKTLVPPRTHMQKLQNTFLCHHRKQMAVHIVVPIQVLETELQSRSSPNGEAPSERLQTQLNASLNGSLFVALIILIVDNNS